MSEEGMLKLVAILCGTFLLALFLFGAYKLITHDPYSCLPAEEADDDE